MPICGDGDRLHLNAASLVGVGYHPLEYCDDGDLSGGDGCSSTCTVEDGYSCTHTQNSTSVCTVVCGDNYHYQNLTYEEVCEDGNTVA